MAASATDVVSSEALRDHVAYLSSDASDLVFKPQDKGSCIQCMQENQPIPRYCQHSFSVSAFFILLLLSYIGVKMKVKLLNLHN